MIIPGLTTNFVDSLMQTKNTLRTKNMSHVFFCEDGFAVGLAYILRLLKQSDKFTGLNWFESVIGKHEKDKQTKATANSTEYKMIILRAEAYQKEFEGLFYSFIAAQQYFK
jgi:hypothetical protein